MPSIEREVVRIVAGSFGNGEHHHEEFWYPDDPGKESDMLNRTKKIQRRLRKHAHGGDGG